MLLLTAIYDRATAESLLNSEDGITQSVYSIPSTVFFGIFVLIGFLVIKIIRNRKMKYGDTGKKTGVKSLYRLITMRKKKRLSRTD